MRFNMFIIICFSWQLLAGQNLLQNGSFENFIDCPIQTNELAVAAPWISRRASPDYYNRCAVPPSGPGAQSVEVPDNYFGTQEPQDGDGYAGFACGAGPEYVTGSLFEPLIAGACYHVEFYVSRGESFGLPTNNHRFGVFFSDDLSDDYSMSTPTPQIEISGVPTNQIDWTLVTGTFEAEGGEQYITLGNPPLFSSTVYMYLDNVKVIMIESAPKDVFVCEGSCYSLDGVDYCTPGTYEVTIGSTDGEGCQETFNLIVNENPPETNIMEPPVFECSDGSYLLEAETSLLPDLTYEWTGPEGFRAAGMETRVDVPGRYYLTTSLGECVYVDSIDLVFDLSETIDIAVAVDTIDCLNESITVNPVSSVAGLSYSWTGPGFSSTAASVEITAGGEYTLMLSAAGYCDRSIDFTVFDYTVLDYTIFSGDGFHLCGSSFDDIELVVDSLEAGLDYEWSDGTSDLRFIYVTEPGDYSVTVTSSLSGCVYRDTVTIYDEPEITATKSNDLGCGNTTVELTGNSSLEAITYIWNGPIPQMTGQSITVTEPGEYILTGTNFFSGCTNMDTVIVIENTDNLEFSITKSSDLDCSTTFVQLDASSTTTGNIYTWSGPGTAETGDAITVTAPGTYLVTASNSDGSCSGTDSILVEENLDNLEFSITKSSDLDCSITFVQLDASSTTTGNIYTWSGPGTAETGNAITVTGPGTYLVTANNSDGSCTGMDSIIVEENLDNLEFSITKSSDLDCSTTFVQLDASSTTTGNIYTWSGPGTAETGNAITVTAPGTYLVTASNSDGSCTGTDSILVEENLENLEFSITKSSDLDCSTDEVSLQTNISGPSFSYNWTGAGFSNTEAVSIVTTPGEYLVTVSSTNGCTGSNSIMVTEVIPAIVDLEVTQPSCENTVGIIAVSEVNGATTDFRYSIDGGLNYQTENIFNNLPSETYLVQIIDFNGCESSAVEVDIVDLPELTVLLPDTVFTKVGETVLLAPVINFDTTDIATITWSSVAELSCTNCLTPVYTVAGSTSLSLEITTLAGCTITTSTIISAAEQEIYIPNVFSPINLDGNNDYFIPFTENPEGWKIEDFLIFNRWGGIIFEGNNSMINEEFTGWNGRYKGEIMNSGVYVYLIKISFRDGNPKLYQGTITLL